MKKLNVYNSSYHPVTIRLYDKYIVIKPKEDIHIETDVLLGNENFKIDSEQEHCWKESYIGHYNQNLILRFENE